MLTNGQDMPLQDPDLGFDIRNRRNPFHTNRDVVQAYNLLEIAEGGAREAAQSYHPTAIKLWLRCTNLFHVAFSKAYNLESIADPEIRRRTMVRVQLLGLAGSSSKPALDALWAGYYTPAHGMIRSLLETWPRVACIRLAPSPAVPYFELPSESPIGKDGLPRKDRNKGLPNKVIALAFKSANNEEHETLLNVNAGIIHMHAGAHPSAEGMSQLFDEEMSDHRNFGPGYNRSLCAFGFKWGLSAQLWLLQELANTAGQGDSWTNELITIGTMFEEWLRSGEVQRDGSVPD